ncbi:MAG TPA: HAMP domain-containing methyl-accepting chemotaxis protein [Pseudorhodoplanes sp.]|nr:HAMP domain-containing methyl-accepting chemotaxis protein [Pseudorhodoplanes sp.]
MPSLNLRARSTRALQIRLTHKIAAIGAAGILGLCLVGGIYLIGMASQEAFSSAARTAQSQQSRAAKLESTLLESRRAEKDFLLRSDLKYAERQFQLAKTIDTQIASLHKDAESLGDKEIAADASRVAAGFKEYSKHFLAVVEDRKRLGLNENSGLEGTLRKSVQAIETKLRDFQDLKLSNIMLMMRRHEKDFMLRRDPKYGDDIKKRAAEFSTALAATSFPDADKKDISQKLVDYQRDFFSWMEEAGKLARDQKATSDAYAAIEPIIEKMIKRIETVFTNQSAANDESRESTKWLMQVSMLCIILCVSVIAFFVGRSVSRPLSAMTKAMGELANGNFDVRLPGLGRKDEIGEMALAVDEFKVKAAEKAAQEAELRRTEEERAAAKRKAEMIQLAGQFEEAVGEIVNTVSSASAELEAAANSLTVTAEHTESLSSDVAAASEQASANVQSVAAAAEELSSSVSEIARQVQQSSDIAREAVLQAEKTDGRISQLSQAASRIGDVVELISAVAQQTNLLALNATIEAARAGEAGRGFAIVAQEVKALAAQTAKATDEISTQIASMQAETQESVAAIKDVSGIINRISEISSSIAAAVEEQGGATQEISRNVQQAATGTTQVASNISKVNQGAADTGTASAQVLASAQSLSSDGSRLKVEVEKFLRTVRAA